MSREFKNVIAGSNGGRARPFWSSPPVGMCSLLATKIPFLGSIRRHLVLFLLAVPVEDVSEGTLDLRVHVSTMTMNLCGRASFAFVELLSHRFTFAFSLIRVTKMTKTNKRRERRVLLFKL
jgi:hypothetical protein